MFDKLLSAPLLCDTTRKTSIVMVSCVFPNFSVDAFFTEKALYLSNLGLNKHSGNSTICKSSCSQTFFKTGVLKNFANFTGKHLCWPFLRTPTVAASEYAVFDNCYRP